MTIKEAGKGIVTTGGGTYRIGFINTDGQDRKMRQNWMLTT